MLLHLKLYPRTIPHMSTSNIEPLVINVQDPWVDAPAMDSDAEQPNEGVWENMATQIASPSQVIISAQLP